MDDQGKNILLTVRSPQFHHSKQLQTHNMTAYDVENTNGTNKEADS